MQNKNSSLNDDFAEDDGYVDMEEEQSDENSKEEVGNDGDSQDDAVSIPKSKVILMKKLFDNIKSNSEQLAQLMSGFISREDEERISIGQVADESFKKEGEEEGNIVEGVFDGESMIGPDGKKYSVPANYASKSKLIEGDIMKLTITGGGTFIYKQIGPIERARVIGQLEKEADGAYYVAADGKRWRVLPASITYFKGQPGDEVVILVPKSGESRWAAVENIIRTQV